VLSPHPVAATLENLRFDNRYARLPEHFYSRVEPTPMPAPYTVAFNPEVARLIGLDPDQALRPEFAEYFSGARLLPGAEPLAMLYAGHQFGSWVPQLGDGRAILLGQVIGGDGVRYDLHLKGAGRTPYSRGGDGRAVLRSSIREYLCSEALHGLGIPTTRALCIVGSDLPVYRDDVETGAMLLRVAPSHVRFGHFEVFLHRNQIESIRALAEHVIEHHHPDLIDAPDKYPRLLRRASEATAELMARWQAAGFAHGVMNTDNMSILGITLDYGPFGFLDTYDPGFICNHSDSGGRYAFDQQPNIGAWNVTRLAQALSPLMTVEQAQEAIAGYPRRFADTYLDLMTAKLGLAPDPGLPALIVDLLARLHANRVDYTRFMRALADFSSAPEAPAVYSKATLRDMFLDREAFDVWAARYRMLLSAQNSDDAARAAAMKRVNPKYILRNHLAETAIRRAVDERDYSEIETLRALLSRPFDEQPEMEPYAAEPPEWASAIEVSCSS
jgi:uncharacterized protein YdiU (UPF0061 family)